MSSPYLSIVIPAYNEEPRIRGSLEQVLDYLRSQTYSWEVVVADDGSTDATASEVERLGTAPEAGGSVKLLRLAHGGKGWAVRHGMLEAQGEYRFMCDADLSMPIEQVSRFLPPQSGDYDIAIGSREIPGSRRIGEPRRRKLMAWGFSSLVRTFAVPGISDTQCGFKCFRAEAADRLFSQQRMPGFAFDVEVLFLARKQGQHMVEVPIDWYYRAESKVQPLRDSAAMARDVVRIRWHYLKGDYRQGRGSNTVPTVPPAAQ